MRREFKLQDPGEGVHEVEINEILVSEGDQVSEGDDVLVVESDKAAIELPSPYSGKVAEIRVSEGDVAEVGNVLMVFEVEGEDAGEETEEEAGDEEAEEESGEGAKGEEKAGKERQRREETAEREEKKERESKAGEKDGEEADEKAVKKRKKAEAREAEEDEAEEDEGPIRAAPAARKLAKEEGVDLAGIEPTGSTGHITLDDVRAALGEAEEEPAEEEPAEQAPAEAEAERDEFGPVERMKLRSIRAATARAMARSWSQIPHVTHEDMADITGLERWRREQVRAEGDETLTLTPFILKAAAAVLRRHPRFNARLDEESGEIVLRQYYNLNVAVATERGLITPVIREVDRKPVRALAHELAEVTERMHEGKASKQDLRGGTFTVTNVGGLGGTSFAPIINPPQTAILGCARARLMPVAEGDVEDLDSARTEIRLMLPLVVAFDHRVLDGADAARFVNELAGLLGDVKAFALDV